MPPRVSIRAAQTIIDSDPDSDAAAAAQFRDGMAFVLDDLLSPEVQHMLRAQWSQAEFRHHDLKKLGSRTLEKQSHAGKMLTFLLERAPLPAWIETVTGCATITSVYGKLTQMRAGDGHQLHWHNDLDKQRRMVGITVNLGSEPYEGGRFEMRPRHSEELLLHHDHNKPGSAFIFQIGRDILHRLTPVTSGGPRTVFAGWFMGAGSV